MNNVGIYTRVSGERQLDGYSLSEQEEKLKAYCKAKDWNIYEVYSDPAISGSTITDRPALQRMIKDVKHKKIDTVLVYKLDRLSRSQKDTLYLIEDVFNKYECAFISMQESFDTSTPVGKAFIGLLSVFAQFERDNITERMLMGRVGRVKSGKWSGSPTPQLGYDIKDGLLVVNEYEKKQVIDIFDMFVNKGMSFRQIRDEMMSRNYHNKNQTYKHVSSINRIITNPIYNGFMKYGDELYKGNHEVFIDKEIFAKAKKIMEHPRYSYNVTGEYYLSGLLFCKHCGGRYCGRSKIDKKRNKKRQHYTCYSRSKFNKHMIKDPNCKNKNYKKDELEKIVFDEIRKLQFDESYFNDHVIEDNTKEKINDLKSNIKVIDNQIDKLIDLYSVDGISINKIQEKIESLSKEKESLEERLEIISNKPQRANMSEIKESLELFNDLIENGDTSEIKAFLKALIEKIEIDNEDVIIYWNF